MKFLSYFSIKSKKKRSMEFFRFSSLKGMKVCKSESSHFKLWNVSVLKIPRCFCIPLIKLLPTCFLFIKTSSIPSPNGWISTHLNTWKAGCFFRQRERDSWSIEMSCSHGQREFGTAAILMSKLIEASQGRASELHMRAHSIAAWFCYT